MRIFDRLRRQAPAVDLPSGMRYRAFLSYRSTDLVQAEWLHRQLESYRIPQAMVGKLGRFGPVPSRLGRIFRDREELRTAADIETLIAAELRRSEQLIVLCTPAAVTPGSWVPREIELFRTLRPTGLIHAVIGKGEPPSVFPLPLTIGKCQGEVLQPLAADLRTRRSGGGDGRRKAIVRLAAGMVGVEFDDLWQRERVRQRRKLAAGAVLVSSIAFAFLFFLRQAAWRDNVLVADLAIKAITRGDSVAALRLAVASVPPFGSTPLNPVTPEADAALRRSFMNSPVQAAFGAVGRPVKALAVSADGERMAVGTATGTVFLLGPGAREVVAQIEPVTNPSSAGMHVSLAFAPNGNSLAATWGFGGLRIIDRKGAVVAERAYSTGMLIGFSNLSFNADGARIVASRVGEIWVFNSQTGAEIRRWKAHEDAIFHIVRSPDPDQLLSCGSDGTVRLWSLAKGELMQEFQQHAGAIMACGFDTLGQRIFSTSADGLARVSAIHDKTERFEWKGVGASITAAAFSPNSAELAIGTQDGVVRRWTYAGSAPPLRAQIEGGPIRFLTYAGKGNRVIAVSNGGFLATWYNARRWPDPALYIRAHPGETQQIAATADGERILTSGIDNSVRLWRTTLSREWDQLSRAEQDELSTAALADGATLRSIATQRAVQMQYLGNDYAEAVPPTPSSDHDAIRNVIVSPDTTRVLVMHGHLGDIRNRGGTILARLAPPAPSQQGAVSVGATLASRTAPEFHPTNNLPRSMALNPPLPRAEGVLPGWNMLRAAMNFDGSRIAGISFSFDEPLLWDGASGKLLAQLAGGKGVQQLTFSLKGQLLVGAIDREAIGIWESVHGDLIRKIDNVDGSAGLALSPDGVFLAASGGGQTQIIRIADGRLQARIAAAGNALTFSPNTKYLAMVVHNMVTLWDAQHGFELGEVGAPSDEFPYLAFNADGKRLGIAARSGGIWEWNLARATNADLGALRRHVCMETLRYAGAFTSTEIAADPILSSRPENWDPCQRHGPLDPAYYGNLFRPAIEARSPLEDTWPLLQVRLR